MESGYLGETRRGERTTCQLHQHVYVWCRLITCRQKNKVINKVKLTFAYTLRWDVLTLGVILPLDMNINIHTFTQLQKPKEIRHFYTSSEGVI